MGIKDYIYGLIILALASFGVYYTIHERDVGKQEIENAVKLAKDKLDKKTQQDTLALQQKADKAQADSNASQKALDDYMRAHPTKPIGVCPNSHSSKGLPSTAQTQQGNADSGSGPSAVSQVPSGDTSGPTDTLVRAAAELARLYRQFQSQPVSP